MAKIKTGAWVAAKGLRGIDCEMTDDPDSIVRIMWATIDDVVDAMKTNRPIYVEVGPDDNEHIDLVQIVIPDENDFHKQIFGRDKEPRRFTQAAMVFVPKTTAI